MRPVYLIVVGILKTGNSSLARWLEFLIIIIIITTTTTTTTTIIIMIIIIIIIIIIFIQGAHFTKGDIQ